MDPVAPTHAHRQGRPRSPLVTGLARKAGRSLRAELHQLRGELRSDLRADLEAGAALGGAAILALTAANLVGIGLALSLAQVMRPSRAALGAAALTLGGAAIAAGWAAERGRVPLARTARAVQRDFDRFLEPTGAH